MAYFIPCSFHLSPSGIQYEVRISRVVPPLLCFQPLRDATSRLRSVAVHEDGDHRLVILKVTKHEQCQYSHVLSRMRAEAHTVLFAGARMDG